MSDLVKYLLELRKRLLCYLLVLGIVFIGFACIANQLYQLLALPLLTHFSGTQALIATSITTPLMVPLKTALIAAVFVTMPYFLYQLWVFIAPALYRHERRLLWLLLFTSVILFYVGILFAYWVVLPLVFQFFLAIAPAGVEVKPDIALYLSFVLRMFFAFGLSFELPVAIMVLIRTGVTTRQQLAQKRPYVIVGAFVVGMFLTPPDIVSQLLLAIPLWLLFELGLWLSTWVQHVPCDNNSFD